MKEGSIFQIALELIKMAKTSVWYFFRNVSSISNSTQHFNEFLVSMARQRHRHKSLYCFFFALLCFQQRFVISTRKTEIILVLFLCLGRLGRQGCTEKIILLLRMFLKYIFILGKTNRRLSSNCCQLTSSFQ